MPCECGCIVWVALSGEVRDPGSPSVTNLGVAEMETDAGYIQWIATLTYKVYDCETWQDLRPPTVRTLILKRYRFVRRRFRLVLRPTIAWTSVLGVPIPYLKYVAPAWMPWSPWTNGQTELSERESMDGLMPAGTPQLRPCWHGGPGCP